MDARQKEIIRQMRFAQVDYPSIAAHLGLSVNTVKSFCFRNGLNTAALVAQHPLCKCCGKPMPDASKTRPRKFCSAHCKTTWWNQHRWERQSDRMTQYTCKVCGRIFYDYVSSKRCYCSKECLWKRGEQNA